METDTSSATAEENNQSTQHYAKPEYVLPCLQPSSTVIPLSPSILFVSDSRCPVSNSLRTYYFMIDPKLNELPVDAEGDFANRPESTLTEEEKAIRLKQTRAGYSVNDSIAANSELSDGGRGVNVSGTRTGEGAGAGSTNITPSRPGEASNTEVVGGGRGSGVNYQNNTEHKESK